MTLTVPTEFESFIVAQVATGRFTGPEHVIVEALDMLRRESELRAMIQEGMDACDRGDVVDGEVVFEHFRQRARAISERG